FVKQTLLLGVFAIGMLLPFTSAFADNQQAQQPNKLIYVIPVHQTIESGLESFLKRAFHEAEQANAAGIVLDLDTFGGRVDAAVDIGTLIRSSPVPTTAFIHGKAISAGSYIALNANKIVMEPGSSIGAAAVVDSAGNEITSPKVIAMWAGEMRAAAELRGRNPQIAEGMVDKSTVVDLPAINRTFAAGQIVSLSAEEALKVGYADSVSANEQQVLHFIGADGYTVIHVTPSPAEVLARWLTNPFVMTVLLLIGIAGVAIELFVPGFGVPGILGILSFGLYFFGQYIAGFAGWEDLFLFVIGIILLVIELFVPSFGILGILGIIAIIAGVVLAAYDTGNALQSLGIAFIMAVIFVWIFTRIFKRKGIWNRFILQDQLKTELGYTSNPIKNDLLGKHGVSLTPLRPAGVAWIDEDRVDVVTSGEFISVNAKLKVVRVDGNKVIVREES
ncbi:MAG: serine protease, partial [Paenibacillus sp. RIFOXYA1_FULL_44_5]